MADKEVFAKERNQSSKETFMTFLCNKRTGEFCGRTPGSWAKILLFYIIFYACLAAFWAVMLLIFYQTIDYKEPKWQLEASRIGTNPGLGFRPRAPSKKVESTLIWFSANKEETYRESVEDLKSFLNVSDTESADIASADECNKDEAMTNDKFCRFDEKTAITTSDCTETDMYGYKSSKPCVLIKLNRIFGWVPIDFEDGKVPEEVMKTNRYKKGHILITCAGENPADKENIGTIDYYPPNGISFKYFPFKNKPGYVSPFVWVKFTNTTPALLINVECKAWAKNIKHDRMDREGSVHFELLID